MKHLELVQNTITRMGSNSTGLKSYCMAIVAAVIGLAGAIEKPKILLLALPVVLVCSVLDASYLRLERGFRGQLMHCGRAL
jgi:histidine triad (HIT) family protein